MKKEKPADGLFLDGLFPSSKPTMSFDIEDIVQKGTDPNFHVIDENCTRPIDLLTHLFSTLSYASILSLTLLYIL